MSKRAATTSPLQGLPPKRAHTQSAFLPNKIASREVAAHVDEHPPLPLLLKAVQGSINIPAKGQSIVYWMRMGDLRIADNRALSLASAQAKRDDIPLVVVFVLSPQDYIAHDRSARRIDFTLRNLAKLKTSLSALHVPLHTTTHTPRLTVPSHILSLLSDVGCTSLYANIEYEVDELRRDIKFCSLAGARGVKATFAHNKCVVEPGAVLTKDKKSYAVYSPYQRTWLATINANISHFLEDCPLPHANSASVRNMERFSSLFETPVPAHIPGFELSCADRRKMEEIWPAGEEVAAEILVRFLHTASRSSQLGAVNPLASCAEETTTNSRILKYDTKRDRADQDTTSRLSPYLSAGVISSRECVRATMRLLNVNKVEGGRTSGIGRWVQEIAWRDFYTTILAAHPRVSMGRPFLEKLADVVWEDHQAPGSCRDEHGNSDGEILQKWKEGKTGVPIVDAAMRCLNEMGWLHNRMRMITAMFLTKDLMIDWRVGERYFMQQLIDGDLASNNGGWQWCASTGVDPCPYFRIFNPYTQSAKADPTGDFIRHWIPELRNVKGSDLHNPSVHVADKFGYPRPIVNHNEARQRALRRFKNPGEE